MKNPYKVPMAQYLLQRLGRWSQRTFCKALGGWYCNICHTYHLGNVIAYELECSSCYEDFTICHKGLERLKIDITQRKVKSYNPTMKSVLITNAQAAEIFREEGA